jgi:hypothetical protein
MYGPLVIQGILISRTSQRRRSKYRAGVGVHLTHFNGITLHSQNWIRLFRYSSTNRKFEVYKENWGKLRSRDVKERKRYIMFVILATYL